jgi:dTMP kinase
MTSITIPGGLLVAIEGIDGAGKSTLAKGLTERLRAHGVAVSVSKEPTNGPWGTKLRQSAESGRLSPEEEVEYLLADRREHVEQFIRPALQRGEVVILDRYFPSMVAYQGAAGLPVDDLSKANDFAPRPHLMILLDVEPATGLDRIRARGDRPNHFESEDNLARCRQIFLVMSERSKWVIDASKSEADVLEDSYARVVREFAQNVGELSLENIQKVQSLLVGHLA